MNITRLTGDALGDALEDLAQLRMTVFRDWPYLYDGDLAYERQYLEHYQSSEQAIVVAATIGDWLVGASTATPLADHADEFRDALAGTEIDIASTFYCGESVLLPRFRGQGVGHQFFDMREDHARTLGYTQICFCSVIRPEDHPLRPAAYTPLDGFWRKRGYAPVPGAVARFAWKDVDTGAQSEKPLQFWTRRL
ncbi:GNAT family N-acetyltransferase [Tateyamaria sp. SN6-1]|uniref:GNAT family N-acetyltransferase n=1 Tax=Tateyamaria sp. SN6-1 TaxID=3092148 RepID=UPI0039F5B194